MAFASQPSESPPRRGLVIAAFVLWPVLWSIVPALIVWSIQPYLTGRVFVEGRTYQELQTELNNRYAVEYLILGGLLGSIGGAVSLRLTHKWQAFMLSVAVGVALVTVFNFHNFSSYYSLADVATGAVLYGVPIGLLLGLPLAVIHRRTIRSTGAAVGRRILKQHR